MTNFYEKNYQILCDKFLDIAKSMDATKDIFADNIKIKETEEGPVLCYNGQYLDNPTKPLSAGKKWIESQQINNKKNFNTVIFGFGLGYHIENFVKKDNYKLTVIISLKELFKEALKLRDLKNAFDKIDNLIFYDSSNIKGYLSQNSEFYIRPQEQALFYNEANTLKHIFYGNKGFNALSPKIGVLGPMSGGTLPMIVYLDHALTALNQKHRIFDMEPFNQGYNYIKNFVKDEYGINVINNSYVENLSQMVVASIKEKPIDILICLAQAPISPKALTQIKSMGVITVLWFVEDYIRFSYWKNMAPFYDFIFTIQKDDCIDAIKNAGCQYVNYLPVACDELIHRKRILTQEEQDRWGSEISFFGAGYHNRQQFFASMCEMPLKIWGTEWPTCKPFDRMVQEGGRRLTPDEYIKIFNGSKININLHSSTECDGVDPYGDFVNPRTIELASSEAFQLVDKRSLLSEMFKEGEEIITFSSRDELRELIDYYLHHEGERKDIIQKSKARALKDHTYTIRIKEMLSVIYSQKYEQLRERFENSDWEKMIVRSKKYPELEERILKAYKRGEEANLDALISDIVTGKGDLTETEQKLLFLHHIRSQIIRMSREDVANEGGRA